VDDTHATGPVTFECGQGDMFPGMPVPVCLCLCVCLHLTVCLFIYLCLCMCLYVCLCLCLCVGVGRESECPCSCVRLRSCLRMGLRRFSGPITTCTLSDAVCACVWVGG
jgi:hypothetical protein